MNVKADLSDATIELGSKGIHLAISEPGTGKHIGTLRIGKAKVEWFEGKQQTGKKLPLPRLLDLIREA